MDYVIFDWITVFWGVVASLFTFVLGTVVLIAVVATLPPTFLQIWDSWMVGSSANPVLHCARRVGKNLIGLLVIVIGLLLALPGVPGPGLPMALLGLMLVDFPGKRRLMQRLLRAPRVIGSINALRVRLGKPPLVVYY
jgi:hypothetical protein